MGETPESTSSIYEAVLQERVVTSDESCKPIQVTLIDNENLWSQFSKLGTEMIITKTGRQMFPSVKFRLENLKPYAFYKVYMELAPVDNMRYKYQKCNWAPRGTTETALSSAWVTHPHSPSEGFKWMVKPVDFNVKLTNCLETANGETVCLRSMYKYMIIIHVEEGSDLTHRNRQLMRTFPLVRTTFMAVTTYRNPMVKDLKTNTNIHAKGIRTKKLKFMEAFYENIKENFSGTAKRFRMEHTESSLTLEKGSPSSSEGSTAANLLSTSPALPSRNGMLHTPTDFMNRNNPFALPDLPTYHRVQTPSTSERIPLTTPLTVHCPLPYLHYERLPFYNTLLPAYPQNLPFYQSSHSFLPNNWPLFSTRVLQSNCNCRSHNRGSSSNFNVCPACRDYFAHGPSRNVVASDNAAPSSTTDPEGSLQKLRIPPPVSSSTPKPGASHLVTPESTVPSPSSDENSLGDSSAMDEISSTIAEVINSSGAQLDFTDFFHK